MIPEFLLFGTALAKGYSNNNACQKSLSTFLNLFHQSRPMAHKRDHFLCQLSFSDVDFAKTLGGFRCFVGVEPFHLPW